ILRLRRGNPSEDILAVANNAKENVEVRVIALRTLLEYDTSLFNDNILKMYLGATDRRIQGICIELLANERQAEITEAMMEHIMSLELETIDDYAVGDLLLAALNKRIGTSCRTVKEMRSAIIELRKKGT